MRRLPVFLILLAMISPSVMASASGNDQAARVVSRFFQASGGLEQVKNLQSISISARTEAYNYEFTMHLLADGRFRIEAADRTTVYDGQDYWQSFHGVVQTLTGDALDDYRDVSMRESLFHGFLDAEGQPAKLEYAGKETAHGQTYELLGQTTPEGNQRTYYLNTSTGLVDKMVELVPDPDLRELKNIFTYADYQDVGGLMLPTEHQGLCITNGEGIQPLTHYSDFKLNEKLDEELFVKPESETPLASLLDGALCGQVVGISGGGSLITNITSDDLAKLAVSDGTILTAQVKEHETRHVYMSNLQGFGEIGSGDYLAIFNRTPTLWLVKAYVGMTSNDSTYTAGDKVRLTVTAETDGEAGK